MPLEVVSFMQAGADECQQGDSVCRGVEDNEARSSFIRSLNRETLPSYLELFSDLFPSISYNC